MSPSPVPPRRVRNGIEYVSPRCLHAPSATAAYHPDRTYVPTARDSSCLELEGDGDLNQRYGSPLFPDENLRIMGK